VRRADREDPARADRHVVDRAPVADRQVVQHVPAQAELLERRPDRGVAQRGVIGAAGVGAERAHAEQALESRARAGGGFGIHHLAHRALACDAGSEASCGHDPRASRGGADIRW
jgi:hypothetical protein